MIPSIVGSDQVWSNTKLPEGVPDRLALVDLHRRRPVGVVADDHVGAAVDDHPGQLLLRGEGGRVVLGAPVREDDDDVRAGLAGRGHILLHVRRVQRRAADLGRGRVVPAGDRVVGQDRDLGAAGLQDRRLARRGQVLARAGHLEAALRQVLDRLQDARGRRRRGCGCWRARRNRARRPRARRPASGRRRRRSPSCASSDRSGAGFSKLAIAMSAPEMRWRNAPASPVRTVRGRSQPNEEQQYRLVISARPAVEREVGALALDVQGLVDATVQHDVAAGEQGPGGGRVVGRRPPAGAGSWAISDQSARSLTRSTPNRASSPQASARTPGVTASARRNARRLRWAAMSDVSVAASGASISRVASAGRSTPSSARIASASEATSSRAS